MKKLNALLHEVTFIDFKYLIILMVRYRVFAFIFPVVVLVSVIYFYQNQNTIYQLNVDLKVEQKASLMNLSSFNSMAGDAFELFTADEVLHLNSNYEFNSKLAENLIAHPRFYQLNLTSASSDRKLKMNDLLKDCDQISCKVDRLTGVVPQFYSIAGTSINNRYNLKVTTIDAQTTRIMIDVIKNTLVQTRLDDLRLTVDRQIAVASDLLKKNQNEIEAKGGYRSLQDEGQLNSNVNETQDKLRSLMYMLNSEKALLTSLRLRLGQNKNTQTESNEYISSPNSKNEKVKYERYVKLKEKQKDLRANLNQILLVATHRSDAEKKLIEQMEEELEHVEKELNSSHLKNRKIAFDESFVSQQQNSESSLEFDYNVQSNKVKVLDEEFATLKKYHNELVVQKVNTETAMLALRPDFEYIKQLESKLMTLKLMKTTLTADVIFERLNPNISSFKRSPLLKITLFSFLLGFFFYFLAIVISYLIDDRIFGEREVQRVFKDIKILGRAPEFRSE